MTITVTNPRNIPFDFPVAGGEPAHVPASTEDGAGKAEFSDLPSATVQRMRDAGMIVEMGAASPPAAEATTEGGAT